MSKPITISIVGNAGPLKKSLKESDDALDKFGQGIKKFGVAAAVGIGALGAGIGVAIGTAGARRRCNFRHLREVGGISG
jgi:transketolase N-terminal domain/subunit